MLITDTRLGLAVHELCEQQGRCCHHQSATDDEGQAEAADEEAAEHSSRHAAEIGCGQEQAVAEIRCI